MASILEPAPTSSRAVGVRTNQALRLRADTAWNWFVRTNEGAWTQFATGVLEAFRTMSTSVTNRLTFDRVEIAIGSGATPDTSTTRYFDLCEGPAAVLWATGRMDNEAMSEPPARPWEGEDDDPPLGTPWAMPQADRTGFGTTLLETVSEKAAGPADLFASWGPGVFVDTSGGIGVRTPFTNDARGLGPFPAVAAWYQGGMYFEHDFGKSRNLALTRVLYEESGAPNNVAIVRGDGRRNTYRLSAGVYTGAAGIRNTLTKSGGIFTETTPSGRVYRYTSAGRLDRVVDRAGNPVYFSYDVNSRLQRIDGLPGQNAIGLVPYFTYNASGLLEKLQLQDGATPANTRESYFTYDGNKNLLRIIGPESCITYFEYNPATRLQAVTDPEGFRWYFAYDANGRVERVLDALGKPTYFSWTPGSALGAKRDRAATITYFRWGPFGSPDYVYNLGTSADYFRYDGDGNMTNSRTRLGREWYYQYDSGANRISVTDPLDGRTYFAYDAQSLLRTYVDQLGRPVYMTYDGQRNRSQWTDAVGGTAYYTYEGTGLLRQKKDRRGAITYMVWDSRANVSRVVDPLQNTTYFGYNTANERTALEDPLKRVSYFEYDKRGRPTKALDPTGAPTYWAYDARCNLVTQRDARMNATTHVYDGNSNRTKTTDALSNVTYFAYDPEERQNLLLNARLFPVYWSYDVLGRRQRQVDAYGGVTYFGYTTEHLFNLQIDARNNPTYYFHDRVGRVTHEKNALMREAYFGHDLAGQRVLLRDRRFFPTYYQYDPRGWLRRTQTAVGAVTYVAFDAEGNRERVVDPRGYATYYTYDLAGRLTHTKDPLGGVAYVGYDQASQAVLRLDELSQPSYFTYDLAGRVQTTKDPAALLTYMAYDRVGNRTLERVDYSTDVASTYYEYDAINRQTTTADAYLSKSYLVYDQVGNVERAVDVRGFATYYTYDRLDRRTHTKDPVHFASTYLGYDEVGNVIAQTDQQGATTYLTYDRANQVYFTFDPAGARTYFSYDQNGNRDSSQVLFGSTRRSTYFDYDPASRLLQQTAADGGVSYFQLDLAGNRERLIEPGYAGSSYPTYFVYDGLNRVTCRYNVLLENTYFEYDARSHVLKEIDPVGRKPEMAYDAAGRLSITWNQLGEFTFFNYDARGNRTSVTNPRGYSTYFRFDRLGRQTHRTDALGGVSYVAYDAAGNRLQASDELGRTTYFTYDGLSRLTHSKDQLGAVTYMAYDNRSAVTLRRDADGRTSYMTYDTAGRPSIQHYKNPVAGESATSPSYFVYDEVNDLRIVDDRVAGLGVNYFDYDAMDRLTKKVTNTGALYYSYDLGGRKRTLKDRSFNENYYVYDGAARLSYEVLDSGRAAYFLYDASGLVTRKRLPTSGAGGAMTSYYTYDSARRVTQIAHKHSTGATSQSFDYVRDPNGQPTITSSPNFVDTYYTYDALDRLTFEDWQSKTHVSVYGFRYAYDAASNRTNKSVVSSPTSETYYEYNAVNLVTKEHVLGGSTTYYAYDSSQRMTSARTTAAGGQSAYFAHDQRSWVTGIDFTSSGGADAARSFVYTGLGERVVVNDSATTYWQHDGRKLILERSNFGTDARRYRHNQAPSDSMGSAVEIYAEPDGGSSLFYPLCDVRGTTSKAVVENAGQEGIYRDDFFGVRLGEQSSGAPLGNQRLRWISPAFLKLNTSNQRLYLTPGGVYIPQIARLTTLGSRGLLLPQIGLPTSLNPEHSDVQVSGSAAGRTPTTWPEFGRGRQPSGLAPPWQDYPIEPCLFVLQCHWAEPVAGSGWMGRVVGQYHCGWLTRVPGAIPEWLGTHIQPGAVTQRSILEGLISAIVEARTFSGRDGFRELDPSFTHEPALEPTGESPERVCQRAKCLRRAAWEYASLGARPYDAFGQSQPNSHSFLGALAAECGIVNTEVGRVADFPYPYPRNRGRKWNRAEEEIIEEWRERVANAEKLDSAEGGYTGWFYWLRKYPANPGAWRSHRM